MRKLLLCIAFLAFLLGGVNLLVSFISSFNGGNFVVKLGVVNFFCVDGAFDFFITPLGWSCCGVLCVCSICVLVFVGHYFRRSNQGDFLSGLLAVFVGVMVCLFVSGSWFTALLFWEALGLVSVFLILFNISSSNLRGAMVTLIMSRFGDAALFIVVAGSHWIFFKWGFNFLSVAMLLLIVTKSAFFPFTSWLPEAMWAPTPVSSLVHSSTLVAAGIWFLFRYVDMMSGESWHILFGLCVSTIVSSALFALFFDDLKKLVALSTCNNIAWCVVVLMHGGAEAAIAQLVVHGVCKCALFVFLGDVISSSKGSQSARSHFSFFVWNSFFGAWCLFSLVLCLVGLPFMGLFFSKHTVFMLLLSSNMVRHVWVLLFCLFLTSVYSARFLMLFVNGMGITRNGVSKFYLGVFSYSVVGSLIGASYAWYSVSSEPMIYWGVGIVSIQVAGLILGALLGRIKVRYSKGVGTLNFSDGVINRAYLNFLSLTQSPSSCVTSRWETVLLDSLLWFVSKKSVWSTWIIFIGGVFLIAVFWVFGR